MPYTEKQHRAFEAIAHGWHPDKGSLAGIGQGKAKEMAAEGVKRTNEIQRKALTKK